MANPTLNVYLDRRLAGILIRKENGNLQFRYDKAYIDAKGPQLSVNLPVRAAAYPHRACLAFFGNLLPEEDVRRQVALATGISAAACAEAPSSSSSLSGTRRAASALGMIVTWPPRTKASLGSPPEPETA